MPGTKRTRADILRSRRANLKRKRARKPKPLTDEQIAEVLCLYRKFKKRLPANQRGGLQDIAADAGLCLLMRELGAPQEIVLPLMMGTVSRVLMQYTPFGEYLKTGRLPKDLPQESGTASSTTKKRARSKTKKEKTA